jgi:hypothetical protein
MKGLWIGAAGIMAAATLSCQREEPTAAEKSDKQPEGQYRGNGSPASSDGGPAAAGSKPSKRAERPAGAPKPIPVAEPVSGQPGMVKSPFNGKLVDVTGIPAGTMVADPTYPPEQKKYFRVPEPSEEDSPGPEDELMKELAKQGAPEASAVPGKAGFVFSPYDNKIIDVSGRQPGEVLVDPNSPEGETRYFKVPGAAEAETDEPVDAE